MESLIKGGDPRRPNRVTPFVFRGQRKDDLPFDLYSFASLWFALGAVLLQVKLYSWLNLLCVLASVSNMRLSTLDVKLALSQVTMAGLTFFSTHTPGGNGGVLLPFIAGKAQEAVKGL